MYVFSASSIDCQISFDEKVLPILRATEQHGKKVLRGPMLLIMTGPAGSDLNCVDMGGTFCTAARLAGMSASQLKKKK